MRDHQQGDGQGAERGETGAWPGWWPKRDDDEHQHEGADDLGDEVPAVAADGRAGREDAELVGRVGLLVEVLLVGQPDEDGTDDGTDQLSQDVQQDRDEVHRYERVRRREPNVFAPFATRPRVTAGFRWAPEL